MQINLLPWRQLRARRQLHQWYQRALSALISSSLLLISASIGLQWLHRQQQQQWRVAQLQTTVQTCHPDGTWQQRLQQQYQQPAQLLARLPQHIPKGVYLQRLQWRPPQLTLQGTALSYPLLANVIEALQRRETDHPSPCPPLQYQLKTVQAATDSRQMASVQFSLQLHCQSLK